MQTKSVLKKNMISLIHVKNQGKVKALLNRVDVEMRRNHTNVEYLVEAFEALRYFQLSNMKYDDRNVVTERVSATVLQLYLI